MYQDGNDDIYSCGGCGCLSCSVLIGALMLCGFITFIVSLITA